VARRQQGTGQGRGWRWAAGAAFLAGFVFLSEIVRGPTAQTAASILLAGLAALYVLLLFLLGRGGGLWGRLLRDFLALGGALLLLVAHTPAAEYLAMPLLVRPDLDRADAIVVLGGGLHANNSLTPHSLERTLYGVELYRRGLSPRILFSGGVTGEATRPEADVMADFARFVGVPGDAILVERAARTTYENAVEVAKVLRERRLRRVLLVTSAQHVYRAELAFRHQKVDVLPAPARTREGLRYVPGGRLTLFYHVLHEYGGLAYYKARGRI